MNLSPEERQVGRQNYYQAVTVRDTVTRRGFLQEVVAAGAVSGAGLGALYFGYEKPNNPVRVGVIGTGDEGCVLLGACNPNYVDVVAICDVRPSSIHRAFHGDWSSPAAMAARPGLNKVYGYKDEAEARKHVTVYSNYKDFLDHEGLEGVIIALPLHLHAPIAAAAMRRGLHVLTEKLMAHNIAQCKAISRLSKEKDVLLATGHQRHYNILYDNAVNLIQWGLLGQIHFIQAQWHRGNLPGRDSWAPPLPGGERVWGSGEMHDPIAKELANYKKALDRASAAERDGLIKKIAQWTAWDNDKTVEAEKYGYTTTKYPNGETRSALEELIRWRIWERTGGGLMAELGSHQLDAASIFIAALRNKDITNPAERKTARPLNVHALGNRYIFPADRDADDHVYCTFEFPGPEYDPSFDVGFKDKVSGYPQGGIPGYETDPARRIVVSYSSINGNGWGGYGEVVMGTTGTLVLDKEKEIMLYKNSDTSTRVGVKAGGNTGPTLDTQESGAPPALAQAAEGETVSRGYTEQIEHWAWCIRNRAPENQPRCNPNVAVADAVLALTAKVAIDNGKAGKGGYIEFKDEWFEIDRDETPDGSSIQDETSHLATF